MSVLPTQYQEFIHLSRYSKWIEEKNRRETWEETVDRYYEFMAGYLKQNHGYSSPKTLAALREQTLNLKVMPSMRALMAAGPALERDATCAYNCSYVAIDNIRVFDEILFVLMNGTGVGFSVERQFVNKLPEIAEEFFDSDSTIIVGDSKIGWAKALKELISLLYTGQMPRWDLSKVRPAGSKLKTFGGRSSGPKPLEDLFRFCIKVFKNAAGRKLTSLECHDIICMIGSTVVSGGVRRSALISLSNLSDERMRECKSGQWWTTQPQRSIANNSAVYTDKPEIGIFLKEWISLYESKSGERGIFSRDSSKRQVDRSNAFRESLLKSTTVSRDSNHEFGTNPCSEIILRDKQFCNLTEVVVRAEDTLETLLEKVRSATILGTFQSTLTHFRYLSKKWKQNTEEERLLGVSLTGIMDNAVLNGSKGMQALKDWLTEMRKVAIKTNVEFAKALGIPTSTAITAVKPSGTVSQLVDAASGIHARHSPYYIRTARSDKKDPLGKMMIDMGFPAEDDVIHPEYNNVFSFPVKAPEGAVFRKDISATEHLEIWKTYQMYWCEHKPSISISVKEDEWLEVGAWVYKNFEYLSGVSFFPMDDHSYRQAPYQDCTKEQYEELLAKMPKDVDWGKLAEYEKEDTTTSSQELACSAPGGCEIV